MNKIDQIFNDSLQQHTTPPSEGLWGRVESGLPVKTASTNWLRWAAILVPVAVAAGVWMNQPEETTILAAEKSAIPSPSTEVQPVNPAPPAITSAEDRKVRRSTRKPVVKNDEAMEVPVVIAAAPETIAPEEITIEPVVVEEETVVAAATSEKPIVLVFTLESVAESPDDATRKENSIDRVVEFARAVKHSDPIGDIRGLKDELFALDFRKKQTKKN